MTKINILSIAAAATLGLAGPALADNHMKQSDDRADWKAESPVVVETNERGQATRVRVEGKVYDVCMNAEQDNCINPRAAGLNWGNRPLTYWPGEPASKS